ncbi:homoserine O-acetyltransferase [Modestobacter sp. I12A-02628]|uniref:Homoserine O-acetyltransferase n=1 Tax=Goekera deserti TaxID=2497753 RepID=A0A7K3WB37_9ACTN|nr:homoserine O-acetyltransferase [Goekera deserti]MPQ98903.1 homoserine O-acetyltransferase [Goekera deserti]NDI49598.1 homoserine O-acetyltransferase [Goekera deserti]NEL53209.1 homoserine O-acetyltransferase [Goekera deserti]
MTVVRGAGTAPRTTARSGGWVEGDPTGDRQLLDLDGPFRLERGGELPAVRVAYETWGELAPDAGNAVLVEHALTGDSHVTGPTGPGQPTPGWWDGLVGPGAPLDTDRLFVVCANVLGGCQGTTGPSSRAPDGAPWGSRFPAVTIGDQVAVEAALADALGIGRWAAVVGGSMGGMRVLEWAVSRPDRVEALFFLASAAAASADQIGTQTTQQTAIRSDPRWAGGDYPAGEGPVDGLGTARRIAHLTYRSAAELEQRFGTHVQDDGRFAVASYLDHHAAKLAGRFDAGSYVVLTEAMNTWDVGRHRSGVEAALSRVTARATVAGIDSDRLYPVAQQQRVADALGVGLRVVPSTHGHDGFLIELDAVGALVRELLGT